MASLYDTKQTSLYSEYSKLLAKRNPEIFKITEKSTKKIGKNDFETLSSNITDQNLKIIAGLAYRGIKIDEVEERKKELISLLSNEIQQIVENQEYFGNKKSDIEGILSLKMTNEQILSKNEQIKLTIFKIILQKLKAELTDAQNTKDGKDSKKISNEDKQIAI